MLSDCATGRNLKVDKYNIFHNELFQNQTDSDGKPFMVILSGVEKKDLCPAKKSAKKSPSGKELKIIELSSCSLDLLSTWYTNSIILWAKF